ncbi:MAG: hypothetical protein V3U29_10455, partial [Phycisphaeraceae bacterium]
QPWQHHKASAPSSAGAKTAPLSQQQQQVMDLRSQISTAAATDDLPSAAALYRDLLELDSGQVLSQQQQLDVANQLMAETRYDTAARAYELFLNTYKGYGQREQVELILGLIYARYLDRRQRARELLTNALGRLQNGTQKELARQTLTEIE